MAQCPNCKRKLHLWNIKAECPDCGVSIPNFEWEKRLEEDALKREESFFKLNSTLHRIKYAAVGTPARIVRLICSFLPIIGYVLPLLSVSVTPEQGEAAQYNKLSLITLFTSKNIDLKAILSSASGDTKQFGLFAVLSLACVFLSLLLAVLAFFLIPIVNKKPKTSVQLVFHILSLASYSLTPLMISKLCSAYQVSGAGTASSSVQFGIFVGIALFVLSVITDIVVLALPMGENDNKYIPTDELQREYAISIGAITADEMPVKKEKSKKSSK